MLKLLLTLAGAEAGAIVRARAERAARVVVWCLVAGVLGLIGLVFLLVALAVALAPHLGVAGAAAAVGGGVLLLAAIALAVGRYRPRYRPPAPLPMAGLAAATGTATATEAGPARPVDASTVFAAALGTLLVGIVLGRRV